MFDSTYCKQTPCLQPPISSSGKSPNPKLSEVMGEGIKPERKGLLQEKEKKILPGWFCGTEWDHILHSAALQGRWGSDKQEKVLCFVGWRKGWVKARTRRAYMALKPGKRAQKTGLKTLWKDLGSHPRPVWSFLCRPHVTAHESPGWDLALCKRFCIEEKVLH